MNSYITFIHFKSLLKNGLSFIILIILIFSLHISLKLITSFYSKLNHSPSERFESNVLCNIDSNLNGYSLYTEWTICNFDEFPVYNYFNRFYAKSLVTPIL